MIVSISVCVGFVHEPLPDKGHFLEKYTICQLDFSQRLTVSDVHIKLLPRVYNAITNNVSPPQPYVSNHTSYMNNCTTFSIQGTHTSCIPIQ